MIYDLEKIKSCCVVDENECWNWTRATVGKGYGSFWQSGKMVYSHREAFQLANPEADIKGLCVCHVCDNPPCCNPSHLFLGTYADNQRDCVKKGRRRPPINGPEFIPAILKLKEEGMSQRAIARELGWNRGTYRCYVKRHSL